MIAISVIGALEASARLNRISTDGMMSAASSGANTIMQDAKSTVHVISGKLKASGTVSRTGNEVVGRFPLPYAGMEEYRIGGRKGNHSYLRPALAKNRDRIVRDVIASIHV